MKILRKVKIGTRLYTMFAFLVVALLFIAYSGVTSRITQINDTDFLKTNYIESLSSLAEINITTGNLFLSYRNYYLEYPDQEKMQVRLNDINTRTDFILTGLQDYQQSLMNRNAPQEELDIASKAIAKIQNDVIPFNNKLIGLIQSEQMEEAHSLIISKELRTLRSELQDDLITEIYNKCTENAYSVLDGHIGEMKASNIRIIVLVAVGFIFVVFFSSMSVRSVIEPIAQLMVASGDISLGKIDVTLPPMSNDEIGSLTKQFEALVNANRQQAELIQRIADGDFTGSYTPRSDSDVVGHSLVEMLHRNNETMTQVLNSTKQLSASTTQIADGSQSLAQGATEQSAAVEQLSASIALIEQQTSESTILAEKAASLSDTIRQNAEKGSHQMDQMMVAVREINDASHSINKVIGVIDSIAFQTNILALNAAVEAARAGQHGKGFAVVAEEVRNLAAKSAEAAKDTGGLIANSVEKAELGARIAGETAASLSEIVTGINESNRLISDIAKYSGEQSQAISQINRGVEQVSQVVQQNSATAEESAAASQEMSGQADMLEEMVAQFKLKNGNQLTGGTSASRILLP